MTLSDAIEKRFPADDGWARRAVVRLGEIPDETVIHDVAHGWLRFGGADGVLVDTLYVLTADRLGLGQTTAETGQPVWVELSSIRALDAIEGLPYPLQAVEIQLSGDLAMLAGWPEEFCDTVVDALVESAEGAPEGDDELTGPFADPGSAAGQAEVSDLAGLGPSAFVEAAVETPAAGAWDPEVPTTVPTPTETAWGRPPEPATDAEPEPEAERGSDLTPEARFEPEPPAEAPADGYGPIDPEIEDRVERFFEDEGEPPPLMDEPHDAGLGHDEGRGTPAAFAAPGIQWPEPFRPVVYFGDHPAHPRRKKNVTLAFSPSGITAVASGFGTWKIHLPWDEISDLAFENADEVKFTHNHRIHMNSTAVVVVLEDGDHMVFEVRSRRPAGMRSSLAPLVNALHVHRSANAGPAPTPLPTDPAPGFDPDAPFDPTVPFDTAAPFERSAPPDSGPPFDTAAPFDPGALFESSATSDDAPIDETF